MADLHPPPRPLRVRDHVLIDAELPARVLEMLGDEVRLLTADGQELTLPRACVALRFPELENTHVS